MENSVIAVQIANGTFVPVLNTSNRKRRRLVVTTVHDGQTNVKIKLYRGADEAMNEPRYVGSLIIDNLDPVESGSPDIAVLFGVDDSDNLNVTATDTSSGEYQSLSVGLDRLDDEGGYDVPDFQLSEEELNVEQLSMDDEEVDLDLGPLEELSFDDLTAEDAADEPSDADDFSFDEPSDADDFSFDDVLLDDVEPRSESEPGLEPASESEPESEPELQSEPESDAFAALADEEFSFDESLSFESEPEETEQIEDLGEEDFTFDESLEDEPLFEEPEATGIEAELDDTLSPEEFDRLDSEPVRTNVDPEAETELQPRRSNAIVFVGYIVLALAAIGVLTYLVFRLLEGPPAPPLRAGLVGSVSRASLLGALPIVGLRRRR